MTRRLRSYYRSRGTTRPVELLPEVKREPASVKRPQVSAPDSIQSETSSLSGGEQIDQPAIKKRRGDASSKVPGAGLPTMEAHVRAELYANQAGVNEEMCSEHISSVSDVGELGEIAEDDESVELPALSDMNPLLAAHMEEIGLSEDDLVPAEVHNVENNADPAFVMALKHLEPLLDRCLPPGFNKINVRINNEMQPNGLTVMDKPDQNYVDVFIRNKATRDVGVEKVAGRMSEIGLHEFWGHAFLYLTTAYLRQVHHMDLEYSEPDEDHHRLLTPQFANVSTTMRELIPAETMRDSYWKCVRADVKDQIETLDNLSETAENWASDHYGISLEEDISSGEDDAKETQI